MIFRYKKRSFQFQYGPKKVFSKVFLILIISFIIFNNRSFFKLSQSNNQSIVVSDNFNMKKVGVIETKAKDIAIEDDFAFVAEEKSISVYNIEDKSKPILLAKYTNELMYLNSIIKSESYILTCGPKLFIFEFVNNNLSFISETDLYIGPNNETMENCNIDVDENVALITSMRGFVLMNISIMSFPSIISEVYITQLGDRYVSGGSFYYNYVLISRFIMDASQMKILIYNITNNYQPEYITSFPGKHFSYREEFVYTLHENFLFRYDLSNITSPWVDNFIVGLAWESFDLDLYHEFAIVLVRDYKWTLSFYDIEKYPIQKTLDFEMKQWNNKLYIRKNFGYFIGNSYGIDIYQFNYENTTLATSFYPSFLLVFIILLLCRLSINFYTRNYRNIKH